MEKFRAAKAKEPKETKQPEKKKGKARGKGKRSKEDMVASRQGKNAEGVGGGHVREVTLLS